MAKILGKQICFKDEDEEHRFRMLDIRARNTLGREARWYGWFDELYEKGSTAGPFLEGITNLLEVRSKEYMSLEDDEKEIVRLMVADYTGHSFKANLELTYKIVRE